MKKLISLTLAFALLLTLVGCSKGNSPSLEKLLTFPADGSVTDQEMADFLAKCGCEVTETSNNMVNFAFGNWNGMAMKMGLESLGISATWSILLSIMDVSIGSKDIDYDNCVEAMRTDIQKICGDPETVETETDDATGETTTTESYTNGDVAISLVISTGVVDHASVHIHAWTPKN